ncbi:hypothetical protein COM11_25065 [Bacillus pseudomycoides]|uniref:hypothetical protein n=1 Tax=Bacillus pseudomycoides TaxID=64104 RepID=UPI000BF9A538|nr:hypothetical protein [Bacillus pseudomycoides]PGC23553.1 hypothetical protein COM11_25065 [Bacillus pseudomycoides]
MFKKSSDNEQAIVITASNTYDVFLFPAIGDNQFHLITENFHNMGYNHFELYVDAENSLLHIYDDIGWSTGGTSAINRINKYLIDKIYTSLDLSNPEEAKVLIYFPESNTKGVGIVTYGYHVEEGKYDFGHPFDETSTYEPFINMAKKRKL